MVPMESKRHMRHILSPNLCHRYVAVFDPLDGSSNVDAGVPTGTIFGIFEVPEDGGMCVVCDDDDESGSEMRDHLSGCRVH